MDAPLPKLSQKESAPLPKLTQKESANQNIKEICKKYLEKHLEGRKFNKEKNEKWGEMIIDDIKNELLKNYPDFGFGIFFYISEQTAYVSDANAIYYQNTDNILVQTYNGDSFYSEVRVFTNKKYSNFKDFLNNISNEMILKINQKFSDNLEGREYSKNCSNYAKNIKDDINNILLDRSNRPCSYHVCFINKLPIKDLYFTYKFVNLQYMPLFFTFSNDSLSSRLYVFIVDN